MRACKWLICIEKFVPTFLETHGAMGFEDIQALLKPIMLNG